VYRGKLDPQSVPFRRVSVIYNYYLKPSILISTPSAWSIPRFSVMSRTTRSDTSDAVTVDRPQSRKETESKTVDIKAIEVTPEANDDSLFNSEANSHNPVQHQHNQNQRSCQRSQCKGSQHRGNKYRWSQHHSFRRRITEVPPIPEQTEDEQDIKDCVLITNTIKVEIIDDVDQTSR